MDFEAPVFAAAADSGDAPGPRALPMQGKDNLTVSISSDVLQQARRLKGRIQISQIVELALAEKIKEVQHPEKAELLRRLRTERDERKGPVYLIGRGEGKRWATEVASWAEIKQYASLGSADVMMADPSDENWFAGPFDMPWDDYPNFHPVDDAGKPINSAARMAEFGRGWLAGVRSTFEIVREEMEADESRDVDPEDIPF